MSTTKTVTLYIHAVTSPSFNEEIGQVVIHTTDLRKLGDEYRLRYALIGTREVDVPVPSFDPTATAIENLEAEQAEIRFRASARIEEIAESIQSLRCLEHK